MALRAGRDLDYLPRHGPHRADVHDRPARRDEHDGVDLVVDRSLVDVEVPRVARVQVDPADAVAVGNVPAPHSVGGDPDGDALAVGHEVDDSGVGRAARPEPNGSATAAELVDDPADRQAVPLCTILLGISREGGAKTEFLLSA
jgi:hypothetical protein